MTQEYYFGSAKWVGASERKADTFSVLRGRFTAKKGEKVTLNILGLGFFKCYINGVCIDPDTFLPLSSDYQSGADPVEEVISGHRVYVPSFDISEHVRDGENTIAIHYGGGWYTYKWRCFGLPKAIYRIIAGDREYVSDESCRVGKSFVNGYMFSTHECHDYTEFAPCFGADFDDSSWENAVLTEALETEYCDTECPADALAEVRTPMKVGEGKVYDCGENTTGYPVIKINAPKGETVTVLFSEEITEDGKLDPEHMHNQKFAIVSDGTGATVQPEFTWFGFRYFEIVGDAEPVSVKVVYAAVPVNSTFECDNEALNWAYKTFLHTMLTNMHTGHPSDCPHLERRGYTGDGQITCHAVLSAFGAKEFYTKWLQDIGDCQDVLSGHIQYTAPYIRSGGGPGGWGCAIVEVPYQMYRHYGDKSVLEKYYGNMRRYIDYLEAHSEYGLVTSDKKGEWCLGDWCGPVILYPELNISSSAHSSQQILIPAALVNTYYMVKSLDKMIEIARIIGKDEDIAEYEEKATQRRGVIRAAYFNTFDGNFMLNAQGANAFAVDIGVGTQRTYDNMISYYKKLGHYDTGILGTEVLTRVLFEKGESELAVDILTGNGDQGFEHWRRNGATTLHEYWDSTKSRSHNHPMFGSPIAYFFEYLLGIRQPKGGAGYKDIVIDPRAVSKFGYMSGSMETPQGTVAVSYRKNGSAVDFKIIIPAGVNAVFTYADKEYVLNAGENNFTV